MKTIATLFAASTLALSAAGCAPGTSIFPSAPALPTVAQVQAITETACAFLPTAAAVAAIFTAQSGSATANTATAEQVAALICSAAKSAVASAPAASMKRKLAIAVVGDIVIHGTFIDTGKRI